MKQRVLVNPAFGAFGVFLLLTGISLFFFRGTLLTSDEVTMAATTSSLVERGSLHFSQPIYDKLYTNYGVGTPIAGIPAYLIEKLLRSTQILGDEDFTLIPLTNCFLFGVLGMLLGSMMTGQKRWLPLGIALLATPLLSASVTFYSEMLASVGMVGLAAALFSGANPKSSRHRNLLIAGAFLAAMAGMTSRVALLPFLCITLFWGWRIGTKRPVLLGGVFGIVAGAVVYMLQNWALRGGLFNQPYEGQDFTTPLLTGLHGLLFSPERGILIFYPALLVAIICWKQLEGRMQAVLSLAVALTLFSLVFHGRFWTWHGGWTSGPRFLMPCLALFAVPVAALWMKRRELSLNIRIIFVASILWSLVLSLVYTHYSAFQWWNQLWGFHQIENQWLFFPQMSLWQNWFEGAPLPTAYAAFSSMTKLFILGISFTLVIVSSYPLLLPYRGYLGTDPIRPKNRGFAFKKIDFSWVIILFFVLGLYLIKLLSGPRGWEHQNLSGGSEGEVGHLLVDKAGEYSAWLDNPLSSKLKLYIKADALYWISVDEQPILIKETPMDRTHLNRVEFDVKPGHLYHLQVRLLPKPNQPSPFFQMYWSWGGEGIYMAPAGGEYLSPRPLTSTQKFFTKIWRRKFILGAGLLALLLLFTSLPGLSKGPDPN